MIDVQMLRVFSDEEGRYGDVASVIVDEGKTISSADRQAIARQLNTGETIFIDNLAEAAISVMHPQGEIDFAGVGVLATAWLLSKLRGASVTELQGRGGQIKTWHDGDLAWVRANLATMPPWNYEQLESFEAVESLNLNGTKTLEHVMIWAWIDEAKGLVRARTFASDWDIPEAQGNGSGSMMLATRLNRDIEIQHGEGSVIFARPSDDGCADVGGRVTEKPLRRIQL